MSPFSLTITTLRLWLRLQTLTLWDQARLDQPLLRQAWDSPRWTS
jgi:hypothetical protein